MQDVRWAWPLGEASHYTLFTMNHTHVTHHTSLLMSPNAPSIIIAK